MTAIQTATSATARRILVRAVPPPVPATLPQVPAGRDSLSRAGLRFDSSPRADTALAKLAESSSANQIPVPAIVKLQQPIKPKHPIRDSVTDLCEEYYYLCGYVVRTRFFSAVKKGLESDLIGEAHVGLLKAAKSYKPEDGPFRPYAIRLIHNACVDFLRNRQTRILQFSFRDSDESRSEAIQFSRRMIGDELFDLYQDRPYSDAFLGTHGIGTEQKAIAKEDLKLFCEFLDELKLKNEVHHFVFVAIVLEGMSIKAVARLTGMKEKTIPPIIFRVRERLAEHLHAAHRRHFCLKDA